MQSKMSDFLSKAFVIFFIAILTSPCWSTILVEMFGAMENPFDYARITDVEYQAVVVDEPDCEGKIVITERLTFDVHAASRDNGFWELWRDLPEFTVDGVPVYYQVNSVKQIMDDGTEVVWEESPELYWEDEDYLITNPTLGPGKWFHSEGPYNEAARRYECVLLYINDVYREEMVFEIEYEMYNASLRYGDCSDLYISMYSGETCKYLDSYKAEILIPNEDMPAQGNYTFTTYGTRNYDFPVTESATANPGYYTFSIDLDRGDLKFNPYTEFLEFDLVSYAEDRHIFTEYASDNMYTDYNCLDEIIIAQEEYRDEATYYKTLKMVVFGLCIIGSGIVIGCAAASKELSKKKYTFYQPTMDYEYFRDIPSDLDPSFASALVFCKHKPPKENSGVYSAILLSLARKNYIELEELSDKNVQIRFKRRPPQTPGLMQPTGITAEEPVVNEYETPLEPLTTCEEYYYNLLARHATGGSISMSSFQYRISKDCENTDTFVRNMEKSTVNIGVREGYFQKADYAQPKKKIKSTATMFMILGIISTIFLNWISTGSRIDLAYGGFFILGIAFIACSIYLFIRARRYILLTQYGEDEYAKWRGLYNFLNSDTLINEKTFIELPLWERYLVYATAFGISEKVIKAISINCPEAASSEMLSNPCYRSRSFHYSGRSFHSAVRTGSRAARVSSYGGGGGGSYGGGGGFSYGGGGRGGGGGGGGH